MMRNTCSRSRASRHISVGLLCALGGGCTDGLRCEDQSIGAFCTNLQPEGLSGPAVAISAGSEHNCAIDEAGYVACWGYNENGNPLVSKTPSGTFASVSAGSYHNCTIDTAGALSCWGEDGVGQVSDVPSDTTFASSSAGYYSCAIDTEGTLYCWGFYDYDADGDFDGFMESETSSVPGTWASVSVGGSRWAHICALDPAGSITCWGDNDHGEISKIPRGSFTDVSVGDDFICALDTAGALSCWGDASSSVTAAPLGIFTSVSAGDQDTCALDTAGAITCWGPDNSGQVSDAPSGTFESVSAGYRHTCAIDTAGAITCWGDDDEGQISDAPSLP